MVHYSSWYSLWFSQLTHQAIHDYHSMANNYCFCLLIIKHGDDRDDMMRGYMYVLCEFNFMNIKRNIWQICETVQQNVFVGRSWDWILEEKKIPRGNDEDKCFPNSQTWIFLFFTHSCNQYQSLHLGIYVEHQYCCDCLIWKLMNTDKCPCKKWDISCMILSWCRANIFIKC